MSRPKKGIVTEIIKRKRKSEAPIETEEIKRTSIALPLSLYKTLKAYAAMEGRKMNEIMIEFLRESLRTRLATKDIQEKFRV